MGYVRGGGYVQGWVCAGVFMSTPCQTWDTMGYGQQVGGMHPTGMLSYFHAVFGNIWPNNRLIPHACFEMHCVLRHKDPLPPTKEISTLNNQIYRGRNYLREPALCS